MKISFAGTTIPGKNNGYFFRKAIREYRPVQLYAGFRDADRGHHVPSFIFDRRLQGQ